MSYSSEVLADSPFAYWKLDETSGTAAADSSGNGHAGTYAGGVTLAAESTTVGNAVSFDGVDDHMIVAAGTDTWLSPAWTLECWVKFATVPSSDNPHCLMTLSFPGSGTLNMAMGLDVDGPSSGHASKLMGGLYNGGWKAATYGTALSASTWHHLVVTWSSAVATIYVDGVSVANSGNTASGTATPTVHPDFRLARRWDSSGTDQYTPCKMQHAAVYTTALSSTRVAAHYAAASGPATVSGTASAAVGGLTAAATGVRTRIGSAASLVGSLAASATGVRTGRGTASAALGRVAAAATGVRTTRGTAASTLGAVVTSAVGTTAEVGAASAALGSLTSSATGTHTAVSAATATLGGLTASAAGTVTVAGVEYGALYIEVDTTPHDVTGTASFAFGGLQVVATSGPPAMALYDEHNNWIANLPNADLDNWQVGLSEPGAMTFRLPMDDASTALATKKRLVKVFYRGKARQAMRIDASSVQVDTDTRRWRVFSDRPGALKMWADVAIFPEVGLGRAAGSQRTLGYMSRRGPWYDSGNWSHPTGSKYQEDTGVKRGKPLGLAYPNPWWISKLGDHANHPTGYTEYFRKEFTTTTQDLLYQILATGDNTLELWLDGEKLITPDMQQGQTWRYLVQITGTLSAGPHVLAAKVVNTPGNILANPIALILTMQRMTPDGNVVLGPPLVNSDPSWWCSTVYPGFRRGDAILTLFNEANARRIAAGQWHQAVETLTCGFDHTRDSHGIPWADAPDEYSFDTGSSLLAAVQQLCEKDLDVVLDAGPMKVNAYNLLGADKSGSVFLNVGSGVTGSLLGHAIEITEGSDNTALMQLADGRYVIEQDLDSVADIGRVEVGLSLGSTSDPSSAADVAHGHFTESANTTYTFTTTVTDLAGPQPLEDFDLGDQISVTDEFATGYYKVRVMAMTFTMQPNRRVSVDVELALDLTT